MSKNLVIVESPAKSATIKKFLGEGFEVKASFGHVVDLPTKGMGIDIQNNFNPQYIVSPDKTRVVNELKALAKKADKVWIATDEDREGEAIGRHVANQLGLDINKTARIVFHEITKEAIDKAIKNPRTLDMHLVDAQQARRVLDRLVGFELSPILRKKIKGGLSAGRVQSVSVRLLVEREREIQKFESAFAFKVIGNFIGDAKKDFKAELSKDLNDRDTAHAFLEKSKWATYKIQTVEVKPGKKSPSAPFTTSTLQQEASRKLGSSVARTMQMAQKLYEAGLITYMRTDSVNMSDFAIKACADEITSRYGKEYSKPTTYVTKSKGSQEAHECIRPTHMENSSAGGDASETRLYELIRKRTLASQMAQAEVEKTKAIINISTIPTLNYIASGEVIKFDGFLKVYFESNDDEDDGEKEGMLPVLKEGEILDAKTILATQKFKNHPPRYTEASLVKKMEELGIGRPSTYAPTISTVQKRGYVVKEDRDGEVRKYIELSLSSFSKEGVPFRVEDLKIKEETKTQNTGAEKQKLFPTDIGMVVTDFLVEYFQNIMDYNFTANVEEEFDEIAVGKLVRHTMIKDFYTPFHEEVAKTLETSERQSGERALGKDPNTGKPVIVRIGRFGPMVQIGTTDEATGEKPKFASMPLGKNLETITLEEALQAFEVPASLGEFQGEPVNVGAGRFGPYVKWKSMYVSIPKNSELSIKTITIEQAIELIEKKVETEKNKNIQSFDYPGASTGAGGQDKIYVLNGMYGPYIKYGKTNYKIPKWGKDATDLTLEDCVAIIGAGKFGNKTGGAEEKKAEKAWKEDKPAKKVAAKKAAAKKPATKKIAKK